jgi:hypothetical protein
MKPMTPLSIHSGIDLAFSDGTNMRETTTTAITGEGTHPTNPKGKEGESKQIVIPLGMYFAGKTINTIMFAYDNGQVTGPFETLFDDLKIESALSGIPWKVTAAPSAGVYAGGTRVELKTERPYPIRYTLDGTAPGPDSPLYTKPIVLSKPGLYDLRYAVQAPGSSFGPWTTGQLYDMR